MNKIDFDFLKDMGFKCERKWDNSINQFRLSYTIEGYDCTVIVSPLPQIAMSGYNLMSPKVQVENLSSMEDLKVHNIGDYQVYINTMNNHLTTLNSQNEMLELFSAMKVKHRFIKKLIAR
jgi:hypothetical protein